MSVCTFIASNVPLPEAAPLHKYKVIIDLDAGTVDDGGADDNYFLTVFPHAGVYTEKKYAVSLEWNYSAGRANRITEYIKTALKETEDIELWHVWLTEYWEFEDRPYIHKSTVSAGQLTAADIKRIDAAEIWNTPDKSYPDRPSFYCMTITR